MRSRACRRRRPPARPPRPRSRRRGRKNSRLGARRVDAEERRVDVVLGGEAHRLRDPLEHRLARDADRVELQVRDRRLDHRVADAELDERLEVGRHRAREAPDLGAQAGGRDQLDRAPVVVRDAREAGLDPVDAEAVEQPRDLELLLGVEHDADRLLAVAERRVVEADVPANRVRVVQAAGPDQRIRSGIAPLRPGRARASRRSPLVIRKLSSTRKPPPPSQ